MEVRYLYDTNVFLSYFAGETKIRKFFAEQFLHDNEVLTSRIVRLELLSLHNLSQREEQIIHEMIEQFSLMPVTEEIEDIAIVLRRKYKIKIPDALIAATAYRTSSILVTRDLKDFRKITEIHTLHPFV